TLSLHDALPIWRNESESDFWYWHKREPSVQNNRNRDLHFLLTKRIPNNLPGYGSNFLHTNGLYCIYKVNPVWLPYGKVLDRIFRCYCSYPMCCNFLLVTHCPLYGKR